MLANEERKRRLIKKRLEEENRTIINAAEASQEGKGKQAAKGEQPGSDQVIIPLWMEHSDSVVECLTQDRRVVGLSLNSFAALCHWARLTNPCLVLVQPRKARPDITEKLLTGM